MAAVQVVSPETEPLKHVRDRNGTAVCGEPSMIDNIVAWGEHTCMTCARIYAQRAVGAS